jgi:hypothetical protein
VWSSDSKELAVVDHREDGSFYLIVIAAGGSGVLEQKLHWQEPLGEWPPARDYSLRWNRTNLTVSHNAGNESVAIAGMSAYR